MDSVCEHVGDVTEVPYSTEATTRGVVPPGLHNYLSMAAMAFRTYQTDDDEYRRDIGHNIADHQVLPLKQTNTFNI